MSIEEEKWYIVIVKTNLSDIVCEMFQGQELPIVFNKKTHLFPHLIKPYIVGSKQNCSSYNSLPDTKF